MEDLATRLKRKFIVQRDMLADNILTADSEGRAKIANTAISPEKLAMPQLYVLAFDETERATSSTSYSLCKWFRLIKVPAIGVFWRRARVLVEGYVTAGNRLDVEIRIGGVVFATLSWTETAYTFRTAFLDIFALAAGTHLFEFYFRVSGGTGYVRTVEVFLE